MCWPVFVAAVALAAVPDPSQAPTEQAKRPLKIAAPGLQAFHLEPAKLGLLSDRLALGFQLGGVQVATPADVAAALGAGRQEDLAGCAEESQECRDELAGALDVDALLVGSAGHFGWIWQVQVKVISAKDGALLASFSRDANERERLAEEVQSAAERAARELLTRTGRGPAPAIAHPVGLRANVVPVSPVALSVAAVAPLRYVGVEYERVLLPWL